MGEVGIALPPDGEEERIELSMNEWPRCRATPRPNDLLVVRGIAPHDVELQYEV